MDKNQFMTAEDEEFLPKEFRVSEYWKNEFRDPLTYDKWEGISWALGKKLLQALITSQKRVDALEHKVKRLQAEIRYEARAEGAPESPPENTR